MSVKPHIAIVCRESGGTGSVSGVARRHATELSKYFRVSLISDSLPTTLAEEINLCSVTPRRFDYLRRFCHVPNYYAFTVAVRKKLVELHRAEPIDFIISHGHAGAALAAKPVKEAYGIPYGLVTHGDIFDRPQGTYDRRLTAFYKAVTPIAYKNADVVFALSPHMAECARRGGANPDAVRVVPNGIDPGDIGLDEVSPAAKKVRREKDGLRLLCVSRLSVEKGIDILIRACSQLKERGVDFTLEIIGSGPLDQEFRSVTAEMGLDDRIAFLGVVERRKLGGYYRRADIFCIPSVSEALALVLLETLISGTPVVGSDCGGIPFLVQHGVNGLLFMPGDSTGLCDAIEELYRKPSELSRLSANAVSSVYPRLSWKNIGETMAAVVSDVLASGCKRSSQGCG